LFYPNLIAINITLPFNFLYNTFIAIYSGGFITHLMIISCLFCRKQKKKETESECLITLNNKNGFKIFERFVQAEFSVENINCVFKFFFFIFLIYYFII
jgi:predicted metal-binding protein